MLKRGKLWPLLRAVFSLLRALAALFPETPKRQIIYALNTKPNDPGAEVGDEERGAWAELSLAWTSQEEAALEQKVMKPLYRVAAYRQLVAWDNAMRNGTGLGIASFVIPDRFLARLDGSVVEADDAEEPRRPNVWSLSIDQCSIGWTA